MTESLYLRTKCFGKIDQNKQDKSPHNLLMKLQKLFLFRKLSMWSISRETCVTYDHDIGELSDTNWPL